MGIPKFYRWISERYPGLSQVVNDYQIPEFDNFYLDMNGIIHVCSHPNDDDPTFRLSEDKIFSEIFRYIETLVRMIKPRKVLFLAVDGVAPRAKMNQQRGRRFRSAREAQDVVRKALQKGLVMPSEPRFDSNCITPGTEFMVRLHEQLKYFVNQKVSTDPTWQSVTVVLSGQEVPGEGEHKIMDYIRHQKAQSDYCPNTRHCLYGLDADLIMLGLLTHEPHFCLLREEVRFGRKNQKRNASPSTVTFHLLHLTILREYIEHEFASLKTSLPFPYSLECVVDDWVLLCFLVGNDFLPNLPNMHIKQSTLPYLYKKYMQVLPQLDGYINEAGNLNMKRFETYLRAIAEFDYDHYSELISDMKWMEAKTIGSRKRGKKKASSKSSVATSSGESGRQGRSQERASEGGEKKASSKSSVAGGESGRQGSSQENESEGGEKEDLGEMEEGKKGAVGEGGTEAEENIVGERELMGFFSEKEEATSLEDFDDDSEKTLKLKHDLGISNIGDYFEREDDNRINTFESDLAEMKSRYYCEKLGFLRIDSSVLSEQARCYVVGVQWVLSYYYHGVPSWSWYYPYHYAPFVSDVKGFGDLHIEFELGKPFLPFEQLLGVLPPASKSLLPKPFQALMVNDDSPIKDYYPVEFHTDLNGKEQEWEAVVLIPFIDEERLLAAMNEKYSQLTKEEVKRNVHGMCQVYKFDSDMEPFTYPSPWQQVFPDIAHCKVECSELPAIPFLITRDKLVPGLMPGVKLDIFFPGFPTLKHIQHTAHLEKRGVRVFQAASRDDNMCLSVSPKPRMDKDLQKLATELVGTQCYVGWPYLTESKVHAVSDGTTKYYADPTSRSKVKIVKHVLKEKEAEQWTADAIAIMRRYSEKYGIDIAPIEVLVYANILQGKRYITNKDSMGVLLLHKEWRALSEPHPYDLSVLDITTHAPEYKEKGIALEDIFKPKKQCFLMANPHYGSQAEILSVDPAQGRVQVKVKLYPEPDMARIIHTSHHHSVHYLPAYMVAQQLGMKSLVLSRISGNIQVEKGKPENVKEKDKVNIGLNLKFDRRRKEMPGYCRRTDEGWSYSPSAIDLVRSFRDEFPGIFNYLHNNPKEDKYYESELLAPNGGSEGVTLSDIQEWLKSQAINSVDLVDCGGQSLDAPQIAAIEKAIEDVKVLKTKNVKSVKLRVKPTVLFMPSVNQGPVIPDPKTEYFLYDRVINVMDNSVVPFGLKGTIIGIRGDGSEMGAFYEILFDEEFLGGLTVRCSPNRAYCLPPLCLLNLSFGARLKAAKNQSLKSSTNSSLHQLRQHSHSGGSNISPHGGSYSGAVSAKGPPYSQSTTQYNVQGNTYYHQHGSQQHFNGPSRGYGPDQSSGGGYNEWEGIDYDRGRGGMWGRGERDVGREFERGRGRGRRGGDGFERGRGRERRGVSDVREGDGGWRSRREREGDIELSDRDMERGRGRGRVHGGRGKERSPRIITSPIRIGSPKAQQDSGRVKYQQAQSSKRQLYHTSQSSRTENRTSEGDSFSAALTALQKLDVTEPGQTEKSSSLLDFPGSAIKINEKSPAGKQGGGNRELSPSVAAVFDSFESSSAGQSASMSNHPYTASSNTDTPSLALKAMLKMKDGSSAGGPAGETNRESDEMPEAIKKLIQPQPRGPLLPHPPSYNSPLQSPHILPHQQQQFFPPTRGVVPDFSAPLPSFMPFGPPPMDPLTTLQHTCHMTGQPPPRINIRQNEQGYYVGTVIVGKMKYNGLPCGNQEEARQSAAAIMNSSMQSLPYYYQMPFMGPPPPGPYVLPPQGPPYLPQMPHVYHPRGPQPSVHQNASPPSFVPLQVQRRQTQQRPQHHTHPRHQDKPTGPNSDNFHKKRSEPAKKKDSSTTRGGKNITKQEETRSTTVSTTCITDDEKVVEIAKLNLHTPASDSGTVTDDTERVLEELSRVESEDEVTQQPNQTQSDGETVVKDIGDKMLERFEVAHKERIESQQKIASLSQTLSVVQDVAGSDSHERQTHEVVDNKVVGDPVAQAAIVSAMEIDIPDDDGVCIEPVQSSDATLVPSGDEVLEVVGEILGGEGSSRVEPELTVEQQSDSNLSSDGTTKSSPPTSNASPGSSSSRVSRPKRQLAASFSKTVT